MSRLLLDTHIWLWYLGAESRLPPSFKQQIDDSLDRLWLSPISIWEVGILVQKGRINLSSPIHEWIQDALTQLPIRDAALNFEVARRTQSLDFSHKDPADQFLAATALVYDLTLVTVDRHLLDLPWLPTL